MSLAESLLYFACKCHMIVYKHCKHFLFQQLDLVSPFQLYFNPNLILRKYQLWRLISTFLFFGNLGFNFFFNMIFTYRYCRMLEEGSFRGRTADFVVMFVFGGVLMIVSFLLYIFRVHLGTNKILIVKFPIRKIWIWLTLA